MAYHKTQPTSQTLLNLPILSGYTSDFGSLIRRTKEFVRFRESPLGPWLYEPSEHDGASVWAYFAENGSGDSCRDLRALDEFVELAFAYDPFSGTVVVAPWQLGLRSVLARDSVILNQTLSFVAAHLVDPTQRELIRHGTGDSPSVTYEVNFLVAEGGGAPTSYEELFLDCRSSGVCDGDCDQCEDAFINVDSLDEHDYVSDWLDFICRDYRRHQGFGRYDPPTDAESLHRRLDDIAQGALKYREAEEDAVFAGMAVESLLARVIQRTNELCRLYRRMSEIWPQLPTLRPSYPTGAVTICLTTPELASLAADAACEHCERCDREPDLIRSDQLRLDV